MYKNAKTAVALNLRSTKKTYYGQLLDDHRRNLRRTWEIIKEVIGREKPSSSIDAVSVGGSLINDPQKISDGLNEFFTSVGANLSAAIQSTDINPISYITYNTQNSMFLSPVTREELHRVFLKLKNGSAGIDYQSGSSPPHRSAPAYN